MISITEVCPLFIGFIDEHCAAMPANMNKLCVHCFMFGQRIFQIKICEDLIFTYHHSGVARISQWGWWGSIFAIFQ